MREVERTECVGYSFARLCDWPGLCWRRCIWMPLHFATSEACEGARLGPKVGSQPQSSRKSHVSGGLSEVRSPYGCGSKLQHQGTANFSPSILVSRPCSVNIKIRFSGSKIGPLSKAGHDSFGLQPVGGLAGPGWLKRLSSSFALRGNATKAPVSLRSEVWTVHQRHFS